MASLSARRYLEIWERWPYRNFAAKLARKWAEMCSNSLLPEGSHLISHDITSLVPTHLNAIPSTTSQFLFLEYSATTNRLRIMLSAISDYCSGLKKQYHDDLPDYDRGTLDGNASAHLAWFILSITPVLFGVYKAKQ